MKAPEVRYVKAPRTTVASVSLKGPYARVGEAMLKLKAWMDEKGIEQAGYPFCRFYDNPGETPPAELRSEACIPVAKPFAAEGGVDCKELAEAQAAETRHEGPPEEFGMTYGPFLEGLLKEGYRLDGPAREYFTSASDVKGPGSGFLIQQPITRG
ncbi:MAG: GyrI-like domain-containing protein [Thaumarchaeota archaeon]|nr:GyrI-like domain-containing protein [Nitrososphaerota archaeon]